MVGHGARISLSVLGAPPTRCRLGLHALRRVSRLDAPGRRGATRRRWGCAGPGHQCCASGGSCYTTLVSRGRVFRSARPRELARTCRFRTWPTRNCDRYTATGAYFATVLTKTRPAWLKAVSGLRSTQSLYELVRTQWRVYVPLIAATYVSAQYRRLAPIVIQCIAGDREPIEGLQAASLYFGGKVLLEQLEQGTEVERASGS